MMHSMVPHLLEASGRREGLHSALGDNFIRIADRNMVLREVEVILALGEAVLLLDRTPGAQ